MYEKPSKDELKRSTFMIGKLPKSDGHLHLPRYLAIVAPELPKWRINSKLVASEYFLDWNIFFSHWLLESDIPSFVAYHKKAPYRFTNMNLGARGQYKRHKWAIDRAVDNYYSQQHSTLMWSNDLLLTLEILDDCVNKALHRGIDGWRHGEKA